MLYEVITIEDRKLTPVEGVDVKGLEKRRLGEEVGNDQKNGHLLEQRKDIVERVV